MLWSRWLKSEADLLTFQNEFERLAGNPLDMAYLQRSRVRGYFTTAGEMLAGFIICSEGPLRYYSWLSPEDRLPRLSDRMQPSDFVEITCIWMKKGRIHPFTRGQVYLESIVFAALHGKPAVLGGTFVEAVRRQQMEVMTYPFRQGYTDFRRQSNKFWLYYGRREFMLPLLMKLCTEYALAAGTRHRRALLRRFSAQPVHDAVKDSKKNNEARSANH